MSPGVLLSTGYIAGGAIAGVLVAFLSFSDEIPKWLGLWQFRHTVVERSEPLREQYRDAAAAELGANVADPDERAEVDKLADEIAELNADQLPKYVEVAQGVQLQLPGDQTYTVPARSTLGEIARQAVAAADKAALLLDLNRQTLRPPDRLPVGAELRLPQRNWPALAAFSLLVLLLIAAAVRGQRET
jgi:hypothetical protein